MKYYDGFGKDVTEYVVGLEQRVKELEGMLPTPPTEEKVEPVEVPIMEDVPMEEVEEEKPKKKRKSVKKNAETT